MTREFTVTLTLKWESDDAKTAQQEVQQAVQLLSDDAFEVSDIGALDEVDQ